MSTIYHSKYYANELTREGGEEAEKLSRALFDACVDLNPHQIEASLFAVRSPLSKGVLLADEVGLGKVDEHGNVTEDLQSRILGQLSERLRYDQLYRDALSDPELKRTRQELEVALSNASEARKVVYELFQDLDSFSLDDYKPLADIEASKKRLLEFTELSLAADGGTIREIEGEKFCNPYWRNLPATAIGASVSMPLEQTSILTVWQVQVFWKDAETKIYIIPIALDIDGKRIPSLEKQFQQCFHAKAVKPSLDDNQRHELLSNHIESSLKREMEHRGITSANTGYSANMLSWVEVNA